MIYHCPRFARTFSEFTVGLVFLIEHHSLSRYFGGFVNYKSAIHDIYSFSSSLAIMITYRIAQRTQIGFIVTLFLAIASVATYADTIQISNMTLPEYPVASYSAVLDAKANNPGTTLGYDPGIDHDLDTSTNPYEYAMVAYAELPGTQGGLHAVDYNFAPELEVGDTYTFKLGFENGTGINIYNLENQIVLADFHINNSNGVTDYSFVLNIDTDINGTNDYVQTGLLSETWATPDKAIGEWEQDLPVGLDWKQGQTYGELTITAISVPEPQISTLFVLAGVFGAGFAARRKASLV